MDEKGDLGFERRYHASGHASGEDITWAIEQIDPDCIVPIHTEARDRFAKSFENVVLVEETNQYDFERNLIGRETQILRWSGRSFFSSMILTQLLLT